MAALCRLYTIALAPSEWLGLPTYRHVGERSSLTRFSVLYVAIIARVIMRRSSRAIIIIIYQTVGHDGIKSSTLYSSNAQFGYQPEYWNSNQELWVLSYVICRYSLQLHALDFCAILIIGGGGYSYTDTVTSQYWLAILLFPIAILLFH